MYLEGNDFGYFDAGSAFYNLFGASYIGDGNPQGNVSKLKGPDTALFEGLFLNYDYLGSIVDEYVDRIRGGLGEEVFKSQDNICRMVAYDAPGYRTVYGTFVFGGIIDREDINTKEVLMNRILAFLLHIEPSIDCAFNPVSPVVYGGEDLEIDLRLVNTTGDNVDFTVYTNVIMPSDQPYGGNPLAGPVNLSFASGRVLDYSYSHRIVPAAPLGTYTYVGIVKDTDGAVIDIDSFEFTVSAH